jgi:hypothetical protein
MPVVYLGALRISSLTSGENSADAYYHVAVGERYPAAGMWRTMPATTLSVWHEHFYDKEWGFHAFLGVTQRVAALFGQSGPPFHVSSIATLLLLFGVVAAALYRWRVAAPWLVTGAFVVCTVEFVNRALMVRPHLFGMLLLVAASVVLAATTRRRWYWPLLLGLAAVYVYSNPHFVLLPALAFALVRLRQDWRLAAMIALLPVAGLLLGLTLHPQFPNTYVLWKIQGVDVVRQIVFGRMPVVLGDEMIAPGSDWLRRSALVFAVAAHNLVLAAVAWRAHGRAALRPESVAVVGMGLLAAAGMLLSQRALEYALPFGLIGAGLLWRDLATARAWNWQTALPRRLAAAATLALLAGVAIAYPQQRLYLQAQAAPPYPDLALWLRANLPPDTVIGNVNWSDFPRLYYSAPDYRYLFGLDPMFGYHVDPEGIAKLEAFRTGEQALSPAELQAIIHTRWVFVSRYNEALAHDLLARGWSVRYAGADGMLFDLTPGESP